MVIVRVIAGMWRLATAILPESTTTIKKSVESGLATPPHPTTKVAIPGISVVQGGLEDAKEFVSGGNA